MAAGSRIALALLAFAVAGCATPSAVGGTTLERSAWVLEALPSRTLVAAAPMTLEFAGGRATGSDSCNRYAMTYTQTGAALRFASDGISTRMACPTDVMEQAGAAMAALAATRSHRIEAGRLVLVGANGGTLARFAPQASGPAPPGR